MATEHGKTSHRQLYFQIFGALVFLTLAEVGVTYGPPEMKLVIIAALIILALAKAALVAAYYMHLRFDSLLFRRLFVTGLVLATFVYLIVFVSMQFFGDDTTSQPLDELPAPASIRN